MTNAANTYKLTVPANAPAAVEIAYDHINYGREIAAKANAISGRYVDNGEISATDRINLGILNRQLVTLMDDLKEIATLDGITFGDMREIRMVMREVVRVYGFSACVESHTA